MTASSASAENQELVKRINAAIGRNFFKPEKFGLSREKLPFYQDAELVRATSFSARPNVTKSYVCTQSDVFALDGSKEAIEEVNAKETLDLNDGTIIPYVTFFLNSLATPDGKFKLINTVSDIPFETAIDAETVRNLSILIKKPVFEKKGEGFSIEASILYAATLYQATISVSKDGNVDINDEQPVYSDLPISLRKKR